jgi:hypothetical protein
MVSVDRPSRDTIPVMAVILAFAGSDENGSRGEQAGRRGAVEATAVTGNQLHW